jgi:hypothetical protein
MIETEKRKTIPGLPETIEEAVSQIEEIETSSSSEWIPLESVLNRIEERYGVYAC